MIKDLYRLMKGNRTRYLFAVLAVALSSLVSFAPPLLIRTTIDSIIGSQPMEPGGFVQWSVRLLGGISYLAKNLWIVMLAMVILMVLEGAFLFLKGKLAAQASESIARRLKDSLYDHIQKLPFRYHAKVETGDLIQRCTSDVETVRRFLAVQLIEVGRALFMLSLVLPIMLGLDRGMTIVAMAVIPLIFVFSVVFFIRVKAAFQSSDEAEGAMSAVLQESLSGIRVVKAFHRQDCEIDKFEHKSLTYRDKTFRLIKLLAVYWSLSDMLCIFQIGAVLSVGAWWAATGRITIGTMVVFLTYTGRLLWPIRQMGRILTDMGKTSVALGRIREILDEPSEDLSSGAAIPERLSGHIEFDEVRFAYNDGHPVLDGVSFTAEPGETIAVLGPTGSGKSTMISLLARLYDYQDGSVKIDGIELNTIGRHDIRKQVGLVLQEPFLFAKSLLENIRLGRASAQDAEIFEAARTASVHDVILGFDKGYETLVGEKGVTLSGGQKQRVAIARALVRQTPILIFDDSLSAVDTETDARIREALRSRKGKATTIIISHRINTLAEADRILVLEEGRISQQGTHEQLMGQDGLYRRIWGIQNALEKDVRYEMDTPDTLEDSEDFGKENKSA